MSWDAGFERVRARMHSRVMAYRALFLHRVEPNPAKWWQLAFWRKPQGGELGPAADIVLRDLAKYCHASKPTLRYSRVTGQSDALAMAFAEGRRDVYNRIVALSNLTPDQITNIAQRVNQDD